MLKDLEKSRKCMMARNGQNLKTKDLEKSMVTKKGKIYFKRPKKLTTTTTKTKM